MGRIKAHFKGGGVVDGKTTMIDGPYESYSWPVDFPLKNHDVYERRDIIDPESLEVSTTKFDYIYMGRFEIVSSKDIERHHLEVSAFEKLGFAVADLGKAIMECWPFRLIKGRD